MFTIFIISNLKYLCINSEDFPLHHPVPSRGIQLSHVSDFQYFQNIQTDCSSYKSLLIRSNMCKCTLNKIVSEQFIVANDQRQISRERENNVYNPKGFQSLRMMSQTDAPSSKSPVAPVLQSQPNIRPNQPNSIQIYIDTALRNQREEMLKLYEQQNKQIEYMSQQQQIILQQQQQSKKQVNIEEKVNQIKEQLNYSITQTCREMVQKLQKQEQTDFKALQVQIEKLKSQLYHMNLSNSKQLTEKLLSSQRGKENETEEYQYKQQLPQRNSYDNYDQYIKKYEQFNKQVNDYLVNRKIPDHLSSILNSSKDSVSEIQDVEYISSDHPLTDITNVPNKITKKLQQIAQPSKHNNQKESNEDSPIKALNDQMMIDSLDNINVHDPQSIQLTKEEFDQLKCIYLFYFSIKNVHNT